MNSPLHVAGSTSPGKPRLRDIKKEQTRRRILTAAKEIIQLRGFSSPTVGDLAKASTINRATFYAHFTSKDECFLTVVDELFQEMETHWHSLDEVLCSASRTRLTQWLIPALRWTEEHALLLSALHDETLVDSQAEGRSWHRGFLKSLPQYSARQPAAELGDVQARLLLLLTGLFYTGLPTAAVSMNRDGRVSYLTDVWAGALRFPPE